MPRTLTFVFASIIVLSLASMLGGVLVTLEEQAHHDRPAKMHALSVPEAMASVLTRHAGAPQSAAAVSARLRDHYSTAPKGRENAEVRMTSSD